ncbi:MAG: hypothetical protein ACRD4F_10130 [Candidatus Angelobacter sp.]
MDQTNAQNDRHDYLLLSFLSAAISTCALIFYFRQDALLLYGDAVAHINIARRVFDSRTPGIFQLGTVWLPLPHLLDIPFVVNDWLWRTGVGAALPSMLAYIAGTLGIFRLVRGRASRATAWIAALIYALNPNLIYMQSTAMTESLYLAFFIWAVVYFSAFTLTLQTEPASARKSLEKCAMSVAAAMLVRYDGWFLAAVMTVVAVAILWRAGESVRPLRKSLARFMVLTGAVAVLWLAYNYADYGNALEFATGPYSAHAIQQRTATASMRTYPGEDNPRDAVLYFVKLSRANLAQGRLDYFLFTAAFLALVGMIYFSRRYGPWVLLWAPLPFYAMSIAWGSVPIYFPDWYPFSYYNVRYGLQMLPAIAVFAALGCEFLRNFVRLRWIAGAAAALVFISYVPVWQARPICLREARVNGAARMEFERQLGADLKKLPPTATLLMDCGAHSGAVQAAGIHFSRIIRETNSPEWDAALSNPAQSADYMIAIPGDEVWLAARRNRAELRPILRVWNRGASEAIIYHSLRR